MPRLGEFREKDFIRTVLAPYATTAASERFEDCVVIDPVGFRDHVDPVIVYSIDHPGRIRRPLPPGLAWRFYGRWIAACTAGDVLAMGARPCGFALDLAVPLDTEVAVVDDIYRGITDVLTAYGARLEGGNLDANERLETVGMCWGVAERAHLIRRAGARPGDLVAVTTELGLGWASYLAARRGCFDRLSPAARELLTHYNAMPVAPHRAILATAAIPGAITSGMDLTDGLCEYLHVIAERNQVGVELVAEWLPRHPVLEEVAAVLDVTPLQLALDPGYDTPRSHGYTIAAERWDAAARAFAEHGATLHRIGRVTAGAGVVLERGGARRPIPTFVDDQFEKASVIERWQQSIGELR